jgi:hypothetical protein
MLSLRSVHPISHRHIDASPQHSQVVPDSGRPNFNSPPRGPGRGNQGLTAADESCNDCGSAVGPGAVFGVEHADGAGSPEAM